MSERTILHVNIVNFYSSIAASLDTHLQGRPIAIATTGATKRIILDCSSSAYENGVYRGMSIEKAKRQCKDLIIKIPQPLYYEKAQSFLINQAAQFSPLAELAGPGHAFIDLTGTRRLLGPAVDVAEKLRKIIHEQCKLDCTVGLSQNRLVSKIATRVIKPIGLCTVMEGCEQEFMAPLPLHFLPGLDRRILEQLLQFNLQTIRDIYHIGAPILAKAIGPLAFEIDQHARGIDNSPVRQIDKPAPSVQEQIILPEQTNDDQEIACALFSMVQKCGIKLRAMGLAVGQISLRITYADSSRCSKKITLTPPLQGDLTIFDHCVKLLKTLFTRRVRLTELKLIFSELTFPYGQTDLFLDNERESNLMGALDTIRNQFGEKAINFWGRSQCA